jgi:hypothetical protein
LWHKGREMGRGESGRRTEVLPKGPQPSKIPITH